MTQNQSREDNQQAFLAFMSDHLVLLGGTYASQAAWGRDDGKECFFALPGFVMTVRGVWCLVTAGHSIQELEEGFAAGKYRLTNCCVAAHFGSRAAGEKTIPFDFQSCGKLSINDEEAGLDFAMLTLTKKQTAELTENGIRPVSEDNWRHQRIDACEVFALLGPPDCLVSDPQRLIPHGDGVAGVINPVLVPVQRIELPPDEMPASTHPWFVGVVGAAASLPSIEGMSGGPVFGFFKGTDGRWEYWIVALQSRWNEERRIIFACPIPVIAQVVERELSRYAGSVTA